MMMPPTIFQVEDDEDFAFLMGHAIKDIDTSISLTIALKGLSGMELLNGFKFTRNVRD